MTWEKPPTRDAVDWDAAGRELMTRPGEFKIVATYAAPGSAASSAHQIRAGKKKALAALGQFEAKARTVRGEFRVYARYVGGAGSEATTNDLPVGPGSTSPEPGPATGGAIGCWPPLLGDERNQLPPILTRERAAESTKDSTDGSAS